MGSATANPLSEEFEKDVLAALKEWHVPGMAIAVIDNDNIYSKGYGFASLPNTAATPETLWYAGSSTKMQTCATLAHLIESKAHACLSKGWETPFSSVIPDDFVVRNEWATQHLTLEDAACHRTGFDRHDIAMLRVNKEGKPAVVRDQVRNMRNFRFVKEPRTKCEYCNFGYFALSHVIETVTGKPLGAAMKETIWDPLDMKSTYADLPDAVSAPEHLSTGYSWDEAAGDYTAMEQTTVREASGAGCIITTVNDLAKWVRCLMEEAAPFSKETHASMQQPRMMYSAQPAQGKDIVTYGLGVTRTVYKGHVYFEHGGTTEGHGTNIIWLPGLKLGIVTMGNAAPAANYMGLVLAHKIIDDRIGVPESERIDLSEKYHATLAQLSGLNTETAVLTDRADPPQPSPLAVADLAGSYHDEGYGRLVFRVEEGPEKQQVLVAERSDVWLRYKLELQHASGTWWFGLLELKGSKMFRIAFPVEFRIGADGKAAAVNVEFKNDMLGMDEGSVLFKREE